MGTPHTPGPWLHVGNAVYALATDARGNEVNRFCAHVQASQQAHEATREELGANVRLIAAAPDLRAALGITLTNINGALRVFAPQKGVDPATIRQLREWREIVVAALCKADGSDPDAYVEDRP